jgi:glycerol-3-phosphate responsive antiterminator
MRKGDIIIAYKGSINAEIIADTLSLVEAKLYDEMEQSLTRKKVYNVLVECLQNLFHHVDSVPGVNNEDNFGVFILSKTDVGFRVSTGNMVNGQKKEILKQKIDKINSLDKEELKEFYKFVLNNQMFSDKGGGGLGLIDIARKTGNKLEYTFTPFNESFDFFTLSATIND